MKPAPFDYQAPRSLPGALRALADYGADAKVLAGGQSLVPLMNFRLARPACLVDLNGVDVLAGIEQVDGRVEIGTMTRQRDVEQSEALRRSLPLLAEAVGFIGHPAIRNRGTFGGSLAHADPAAELPVVAVALDAQMILERTGSQRIVPAEQFFVDYLATALEPDEVLTRVILPVPGAGTGWSFLEIARRHGDFALVAVAAQLGLDEVGRVASARIALGGVGPRPVRASSTERALMGEEPGEHLFRAAGVAAAAELEPDEDLHASADYRRHLAEVLVRRALGQALARCGGTSPHG